MISSEGPFSNVLDLYAGSGALALEALSRGASEATCVEQAPRTCQTIRHNYERCHLDQPFHVLCARLPTALARLSGQFDLVLVDPPYASGGILDVLPELCTRSLLLDGALVVVEHSATLELPDAIQALYVWKRRRHGDSALTIYRYGAREGADSQNSQEGVREDVVTHP